MAGDFLGKELEALKEGVAIGPGADGDDTTTTKQDGDDDAYDKGSIGLLGLFFGGDGHFRHDFSPCDE
jgi:hypothetical protein